MQLVLAMLLVVPAISTVTVVYVSRCKLKILSPKTHTEERDSTIEV